MDKGDNPGPESSGSSLSRTTTAGLSCGSSSSSGLLTPGSTHMHRRHRLVRNRRSTDDDATTSGSHQSSPIPPAPTILCNAGQQTDEISLLKAAGMTVAGNKKGEWLRKVYLSVSCSPFLFPNVHDSVPVSRINTVFVRVWVRTYSKPYRKTRIALDGNILIPSYHWSRILFLCYCFRPSLDSVSIVFWTFMKSLWTNYFFFQFSANNIVCGCDKTSWAVFVTTCQILKQPFLSRLFST